MTNVTELLKIAYRWGRDNGSNRSEKNFNDLLQTEVISQALRIHDVSGSLLSDDEIREAADEWVFDKNGMKWSNNDSTAGDNFGSFIAGAKWALSRFSNGR